MWTIVAKRIGLLKYLISSLLTIHSVEIDEFKTGDGNVGFDLYREFVEVISSF